MTTLMEIGEVSSRTGVPASTIRFYERTGVLPSPPRVNGRRRYDAGILIALRVVVLAKQAGFTLDEVKTLLHGFSDDTPPPERWESLARHKLAELEDQIERLSSMQALLQEGLDCDCLRLDACAVFVAGG